MPRVGGQHPSPASYLPPDTTTTISSTVPATRISFKEVAPIFGLQANGEVQDALATVVARARIPNGRFTDIINDLNTVTLNYGHMHDLDNGEARFRLMAPVCIFHCSVPTPPVC